MGDDGTLWFALDVDRRRQQLAQAATMARASCTVLDERAPHGGRLGAAGHLWRPLLELAQNAPLAGV
jgi:hypothetical protein